MANQPKSDSTHNIPQSPNFAFLDDYDPLVVHYGALAERYVFDDPNTALFKLRQLAECLAESAVNGEVIVRRVAL